MDKLSTLHFMKKVKKYDEAVKRIKELEDALGFYANINSYSCVLYRWPEDDGLRPIGKQGFFQKAEEMPVVEDCGKTAQKALEDKK